MPPVLRFVRQQEAAEARDHARYADLSVRQCHAQVCAISSHRELSTLRLGRRVRVNMHISVHAYDEFRDSDRGKTMRVVQKPTFTLWRNAKGKLVLRVEVSEDEYIGAVGGDSAKRIHRVGEVLVEHDELRELALLLTMSCLERVVPNKTLQPTVPLRR